MMAEGSEIDQLAMQLYSQCQDVPKKFRDEFKWLSDNAKRRWRAKARQMLKQLVGDVQDVDI